MDVAKAGAGERELDAFLNRQARRKGADEANALEAIWAASERRVLEKRRAENKGLWTEHYRRMTVVHLEMAKDFRRRAREIHQQAEKRIKEAFLQGREPDEADLNLVRRKTRERGARGVKRVLEGEA